MKLKIFNFLLIATVLSFCLSSTLFGAELKGLLEQGLITIESRSGSPELLAISNAPYLFHENRSKLQELRVIEQITGTSVGSGNLLFFWSRQNAPLRVMLFNKNNSKAVIISDKDGELISESLEMPWEKVNQLDFWKDAIELHASKELSVMLTLAQAWALQLPYDFLKLTELHGDLCPGVTAGYLMTKFLEKKYPLKNNEYYVFIASPAYCKDDAFQLLLGSTAGKKRLIASVLDDNMKDQVVVTDPAGFVIAWDPSTKTGRGVVLSFNFNDIRDLIPAGKDSPKPIVSMSMFGYLSTPEKFVKVVKEFDVDNELYNKLIETGSNPYELLGLIKK